MKVWRWLLPGIMLVICVSLWFVQRKAFPSAMNSQSSVDLSDLDGDGDFDALFVLPSSANTLWINQGGLQGATQGKFARSIQQIGEQDSQAAAVGDLDGDGDLDVLVNSNQGFEIYINTGGYQGGWQGNFELQSQVKTDQIRGSALGDLDNDGDQDVIFWSCCSSSAGITIWQNDGTGNFNQFGQFLENVPILQAALGDFNGDHNLDVWLVPENHAPNQSNDSEQAFDNQVWFNDGFGHFTDSGQPLNESKVVALGDLDGDGDPDAINASERGFTTWINDHLGYFRSSVQIASQRSIQTILLDDLDQDSDLDILFSSGNQAEVWLNDGSGSFERSAQRIDLSGRSAVALGDLDGDGDLDLFCGYQSNRYRIWWNDGYGRLGLSWR